VEKGDTCAKAYFVLLFPVFVNYINALQQTLPVHDPLLEERAG